MTEYNYEEDPRRFRCKVDGLPWVLNHDVSELEEMVRSVNESGSDVRFGPAYLDDCTTELPHLVGIYSHLPVAKIGPTLFVRKHSPTRVFMPNKSYKDENPGTEFRGNHYAKKSMREIRRWDMVQTKKPTKVIENIPGELHVVLINAYGGIHSKNIDEVYTKFKKMDACPTNIQVLESKGKSPSRNNVDYPADRGFILESIERLKEKSTNKDRLFFLVTNHGHQIEKGLCTFDIYNGSIREDEFYNMVKDIPCNFGLFYFAQCHSGGFAERIGQHPKYIGMSSTSNNLSAWNNDKVGSWFSHYLIEPSMRKGKTIENAFLCAADKIHIQGDCKDQLPQLFFHNADPGKLSLNPNFY